MDSFVLEEHAEETPRRLSGSKFALAGTNR
jgi:hypothetical protein